MVYVREENNMSEQSIRMKREEVPVEQTWNTTDLFPNEKAWESALKQLETDVQAVTYYQSKLKDNGDTLLAAIQTMENFEKQLIKVSTYVTLKLTTDGANPTYQSMAAKAQAQFAKIAAALTFFDSEILELSDETMENFYEENPMLQTYRSKLDRLRKKKAYMLEPKVEETLAALGGVIDAPFMMYERSKASDMKFRSIKDTLGNTHPVSEVLYENKYELSPDTLIRRTAYDSFIHTFDQYKHTYAAMYATEVNKQVTLAKLRGYDSVIDMLLEPHDITREMYENQLDIIQKELAPHMRKLAKIKQQDYQLRACRFADLKAPLDPTYTPETTYEEAKNLILEALAVMGPEYTEIIEIAFEERWIDYADNIGKQSGAFCTTPYGVHPYILTSWTDMMPGAFTLAHELGHAGHFHLAGEHQHLMNTEISTYFVEAPSTLNELLLGDYLIEQADNPRLKRWVISQLLDTYYHNFVTHLLEAEFQRRVYQLAEDGVALTAEVLCREKKTAIANFWGDAAIIDDGAGLTWMRQPHYYMGLYPYTYSAGLTIATAVFQRMKENREETVADWLGVLKSGSTLSPLQLSQQAGVDMSQPHPIRSAVAFVGSLVDQLEENIEA